ncbi:MAG: MFS transporter [Thermoanaerobaculia bacterium]
MKKARLSPQVIVLGLVSLLNDSASEMIYPLLPVYLTTTLGATPAIVGLIEGAADGLASILKYFAGSWSDRMPKRKPFIAAGYSLAVVARTIIAAAVAWPLILGARLLDRTGKGIRSAPRDAMISDVTPADQRGRAYGFHRAMDHTGAIIGPLLAVLVLQVLGFSLRQAFFFAIVPGLIGVALILVFLREEPREARPKRSVTDPKVVLPKRFWEAIAAIALFSLANSSDAFLLLQAHQAGVSTAMLPLLWAAHHVIKSLFSTPAGALSDRIDRRYLLVAGWVSYAAIYFVFPYATTLSSFFVLFVIYAIPFTLFEGAERAWIADMVGAEARGRSFGIFHLTNGVCVLGGTVLFGVLYQMVSVEAAFRTGAALAIAAALLVIFFWRSTDRAAAMAR